MGADVVQAPGDVRVGVDVASVDEVARSVARFGERYVARLFTAHEVACCTGDPAKKAAGLAARFAAKEAAIKVLRPTGARPDWRSIEVRRHDEGWCELVLSGEAARLAALAGVCSTAVSLTHEGDIAAAVVIATCEKS